MKTQTSKKTLLLGAVCAALGVAPLARADYQSTVLSQAPVGYWRLNETVQPQPIPPAANLGSLGATAAGSYNNFPTRGLPGPFSGSLAVGFDGTSQSVTTPWQDGINGSAFSVELWVNPAQVPKFAYVAASAHLSATAPGRSGWYMAQDDGSTFGLGNGFVVRMFYQNGTTPSVTLFATNDLPLGSWYHLVLTFDGTTATLYKNGAVSQSKAPLGFVPNTDAEFSAGCRSDNNFFWPGQEAEVAVYGTALSSAKVANHYTTGTTTPANYAATVQADSPVLYWRFREAIDPPAANAGTLGSAGNGLYVYDAKPGINGPDSPAFVGFETTNKAVGFDAGNGVVRLPALNLNTNTVTISAWVRAIGSQTTAAGLVTCNSGTTTAGLTMDQVGGGLGIGYVWNGNNYGWSPSTDSGLPTLPDSDWAFVAMVIQPTEADLYVCDSTNFADFTGVTNSFNVSHAVQTFSGITLIGSEAGSTNRAFNGDIDEVAIWNRALGAGELYSQYASAVGKIAPRIFAGPIGPSDVVIVGDPLVVQIDAGGTPPMTYVWHKGGVAIATNTTGVLTIPNAALSDSGNYDVTVSNPYGSSPSQQVSVSVVNPSVPAITLAQGFHNRTLYPGASLKFSVLASGGGLTYYWFKDSALIASATGSAYTVPSIATTDAGTYSVTVSNSLGTASAGPATITISTPAAGTYEALIVASTPEAWWRLDESVGSTNLFDGMGRHDGFYTNLNGTVPPVTLGVPGALSGDPNTAASFTAASKGLGVVPYATALNPSQFTLEAWVKTSTLDAIAPVSEIDASGGCFIQASAGWWYGNTVGGLFGNNANVNTAAQITPGQWSHIVIRYDATQVISGTHYPFVLYVNGQTDGYVWGGPLTPNSTAPLIIGGHNSSSAFADMFFDGQVDEVALYGRLLSATEIQNHFQGRFGQTTPPYFIGSFLPQTVTAGKSISYSTVVQGSVPIQLQWYKDGSLISGQTNNSITINTTGVSDTGTYTLWATNAAGSNSQSVAVTVIAPVTAANVTNGLVLHLRFDGNATDSSGRGNNGTAVGSPVFVPGIVGSQALQYTTETLTNSSSVSVTSSSYVDLGAPADLKFGAASSFSIGFWVKLPTNSNVGDLPFIGNATNSNNNPGWDVSPTYGGGGWQWCLDDGVSAGLAVTNVIDVNGANGSINDGAWHHFVLAINRGADTALSYLDGVLMVSRDITGLGSLDTGGPIAIGQDPTGLYPAISGPSATDLDVWSLPATATLDDVGVWNRALTPLEVAEIESAGRSGHSFDTVAPPSTTIKITRSGSSVTLSWSAGTLLQSDTLGTTANWTPVAGASAPSYTFTPGPGMKFYRVQVQ